MNKTFMLFNPREKQARVSVGFYVSPNADRVEIFDSINGQVFGDEPEIVSKVEARKMWLGLVKKGWKRCA